MGLNIKNPTTEAAIRELAAQRGLGLTEVIDQLVHDALDEAAAKKRREREEKLRAIRAIVAHAATLPVLDPRPIQEIMDDMYDEHGLPV